MRPETVLGEDDQRGGRVKINDLSPAELLDLCRMSAHQNNEVIYHTSGMVKSGALTLKEGLSVVYYFGKEAGEVEGVEAVMKLSAKKTT